MPYTNIDPAAFKRNRETVAARRTWMETEYYRPQIGTRENPGRNIIRILPPHPNMGGDSFIEVKMHFFPSKEIGKNGRPIPITINCMSEFGEDCEGCRHVDRLFTEARTEEDPDQQALLLRQAREQKAKIRAFVQLVDMEHPEKGVQRYAFPNDLHNQLRDCFEDDDKNFRDVSDAQEGRDIILKVWKRPGTEFNDYDARAKENPSPLRDPSWLDKVEDLSFLRRQPSKEDMAKAIRGERTASALPQTGKPQQQSPPVAAPAAAPVATPAPAPAATAAPAAAPTAAPTAKPGPGRPKRQPVVDTAPQAAPTAPADPWAVGRKACIDAGFTQFNNIKPEDVEPLPKPSCYTVDPDPKDNMCRGCRVILPCLTAKLATAA